jgi:hypothetical protein
MNADQLWETTMNPDGRTLLRVRVNDPVRAEELFSVLSNPDSIRQWQFPLDRTQSYRSGRCREVVRQSLAAAPLKVKKAEMAIHSSMLQSN